MPRLTVKVPAVHRPALDAKARAVVLHGPMDARTDQLAVAVALGKPGRTVLMGPARDRLAAILREWVPTARIRPTGAGAAVARVGRSEVVMVDRADRLDGPPCWPCDRVVVVDAHLMRDSPMHRRALGAPAVLVMGRRPESGHWLSALADRPEFARIDMPDADVVAAFPDQAPRPPPRRLPFLVFMRDRLRVLTDKPPEALTVLQRTQAAAQFGGDWKPARGVRPVVSMQVMPLQRRYLAIKRAARRHGQRLFILLKYRRGGFTSIEMAESYEMMVHQANSAIAVLAHTKERTQETFTIAETFHARDPAAPRAIAQSMSHLLLDNGASLKVGTAGGRASFRGSTLSKVHCTEVAWWCKGPNQKQQVSSLMAGLLEGASQGEVVLESTPNGFEWFAQTYKDAKAGLNGFLPIFLPWFADPTLRAPEGSFDAEEIASTLSDEERALVATHGLSPAQIAWRRRKKRDLGPLFRQEYPEDDVSCFIVSGTCYFDVETVLQLLAGMPEHPKRSLPGGYEVRWEEPRAGVEYAAGCDTSEGLPGCDFGGLGIIRLDTGAQVAAVHGLFKPDVLAGHAVRMCTDYNRALLGVERQHPGPAVLQKVVELGYGTPHYLGGPLYHHERVAKPRTVRDVIKARAGWSTDGGTRSILLSELREAMDSGDMAIADRELLSECLTFRLQTDGSFAADSGAHDDTVIKWGIAWQMRKARRMKPGILVVGGGRRG